MTTAKFLHQFLPSVGTCHKTQGDVASSPGPRCHLWALDLPVITAVIDNCWWNFIEKYTSRRGGRVKLTAPRGTTQRMPAMSRCFHEDHRRLDGGIWAVAVNHFKGHVCLFYTNINARNRRRYAQCSMSMSVYQQSREFLSTIGAWQSHWGQPVHFHCNVIVYQMIRRLGCHLVIGTPWIKPWPSEGGDRVWCAF